MTEGKVKIRSIVIDTGTALMENAYMSSRKKVTHDEWKNWAIDLWILNTALQEYGFETILVIGDAGSGKSTAMRTLPHNTNIWFNADKKNPLWAGGKEEYGKKDKPRAPYHIIPKNYEDIVLHIEEVNKRDMFEKQKYAIITGHIEVYKENQDYKSRMQVIGNLSNKMGLERKFDVVLCAKVIMEDGKPKYILETENNGFNTVRSPMGLFEFQIPNDYDFVINKLSTI